MGDLRDMIEGAGGLANQSDLARRWGIGRQWVSEVVQRDDFPAPVTSVGGRPVWSVAEADAWRRASRRAA